MPDLASTLLGVRYVVVGGIATSLYMPARTTKDVDVLVTLADAPVVEQALRNAGAALVGPLSIDNPLQIEGDTWRLPDGSDLYVLRSSRPRAAEAVSRPNRCVAGPPVVALPYLVLMKLAASRGVDIGDLTRMLGAADDWALGEVRAVVRHYLPDAVEDMESLAELGRLEFQPAAPMTPAAGAQPSEREAADS